MNKDAITVSVIIGAALLFIKILHDWLLFFAKVKHDRDKAGLPKKPSLLTRIVSYHKQHEIGIAESAALAYSIAGALLNIGGCIATLVLKDAFWALLGVTSGVALTIMGRAESIHLKVIYMERWRDQYMHFLESQQGSRDDGGERKTLLD